MDTIVDGIKSVESMKGKVSEKLKQYQVPIKYDSLNKHNLYNYFGYCLNKALESKIEDVERALNQVNQGILTDELKGEELSHVAVEKVLNDFKKAEQLIQPLKPWQVKQKDKVEKEETINLLNKLILNGKLSKYLNMLYEPQKQVLVEFYGLQGDERKSMTQISIKHKINVKTVSSRLYRAVNRLNKYDRGKLPKRKIEKEIKLRENILISKLIDVIEKLNYEGRLNECIDMLVKEEKEAAIMSCGLFGSEILSKNEIAELQNTKYATVEYRIKKAYKLLKAALETENTHSNDKVDDKQSDKKTFMKTLVPKSIAIIQKERNLGRYINLLDEDEKVIITKSFGLLGETRISEVEIGKQIGMDQSLVSRKLARIVRLMDELAGLKQTVPTSRYSQTIVKIIRDDKLDEIIDKLPKYNKNLILSMYGLRNTERKSIQKLSEEQVINSKVISDILKDTLSKMEAMRNGNTFNPEEFSRPIIRGEVPEYMQEMMDQGKLELAIDTLKRWERQSVISRFGLFGAEKRNQREIGEELGLSQSYISRKIRAGEKKLKKIYVKSK